MMPPAVIAKGSPSLRGRAAEIDSSPREFGRGPHPRGELPGWLRQLLQGLAGDGRWPAQGKEPADGGRDQRHADEEQQQVRHRDAAERRQRVELITAGEADRHEVTAGYSNER